MANAARKKSGFVTCWPEFLLLVQARCGETVVPEKVESFSVELASGETADAAGQGTNSSPDGDQSPPVFAVGDAIKMGNLVFVVNGVRESAGDEWIRQRDGHIYKIVDVTLENVGEQPESISSFLMFALIDKEGYTYNVTFGPETRGRLDGELQPGRKMRGELVFEVPKDVQTLELLFDPNVFGYGQANVKIQ